MTVDIGKRVEFLLLVTRDSGGLQYYQQYDEIKVDIITPEGEQLEAELKDSKDGKYTVTYTPLCVGQHWVGHQSEWAAVDL